MSQKNNNNKKNPFHNLVLYVLFFFKLEINSNEIKYVQC